MKIFVLLACFAWCFFFFFFFFLIFRLGLLFVLVLSGTFSELTVSTGVFVDRYHINPLSALADGGSPIDMDTADPAGVE